MAVLSGDSHDVLVTTTRPRRSYAIEQHAEGGCRSQRPRRRRCGGGTRWRRGGAELGVEYPGLDDDADDAVLAVEIDTDAAVKDAAVEIVGPPVPTYGLAAGIGSPTGVGLGIGEWQLRV
jgi:hypothetical protein